MGGSAWSNDLYEDRAAYRARTGTPTFVHDDNIRSGRTTAKAHDSLDPLKIKDSVTGFREARDSDAHPDSQPVAVIFDVTGSMGGIPRVLQEKLPQLMGTFEDKGYCKDPALLVGGVGDARSDQVPFQVGQFESGIEIDEQIGHIYLEGNGGGSGEESYHLALYFLARKTATDAWEKRGKKGLAFIIGDELPYGGITPGEAETIFGDTLSETITTQQLVREVQEKWNLFYIIPTRAAHGGNPRIRETWAGLIGAENVLSLEDPELVCETVGATVGMFVNALTLDQVETDIANKNDALTVRKALDALSKSGAVQAAATGGVPKGGKSSNVRL